MIAQKVILFGEKSKPKNAFKGELTINFEGVVPYLQKKYSRNVEIGSYPFFKAGKLGVSLVLRGTDQSKINNCSLEIYKIAREKNIQIIIIYINVWLLNSINF